MGLVFRGNRISDNLAVVMKTLKSNVSIVEVGGTSGLTIQESYFTTLIDNVEYVTVFPYSTESKDDSSGTVSGFLYCRFYC